MRARAFAFVFTMLLLARAHAAAADPLTIDALEGMFIGLGFETSSDYKTYIAIQDQTVAKSTIYFALDDTASSLKIYLPLDEIPTDKVTHAPAIDMLKFSDSHEFAFAIGKVDGKDRIVLEKTIGASSITPVTLRKSIESLKTAVDESRKLWMQDDWPNDIARPAAPTTYASALEDADAIWKTSPLELHNLMFVTEKPSVFGGYRRRDSNVFKVGEPILTYAEPFGYTWKPSEGGGYAFGVSMDYTLLEGDKVLGGQEKVLSYSNTSKDKIREFMLNLSLDFNGLSPGKYDLRYTVHDMFSDKTAAATIPFEITE